MESLEKWFPAVTQKAELVIINLDTELRRSLNKMLKVRPGSFFLLLIKCKKKKKTLKKELLTKKDPGHEDLRNSQLIKMAKDAKIKKLLLKMWH